jgi:hypothetical protein
MKSSSKPGRPRPTSTKVDFRRKSKKVQLDLDLSTTSHGPRHEKLTFTNSTLFFRKPIHEMLLVKLLAYILKASLASQSQKVGKCRQVPDAGRVSAAFVSAVFRNQFPPASFLPRLQEMSLGSTLFYGFCFHPLTYKI